MERILKLSAICHRGRQRIPLVFNALCFFVLSLRGGILVAETNFEASPCAWMFEQLVPFGFLPEGGSDVDAAKYRVLYNLYFWGNLDRWANYIDSHAKYLVRQDDGYYDPVTWGQVSDEVREEFKEIMSRTDDSFTESQYEVSSDLFPKISKKLIALRLEEIRRDEENSNRTNNYFFEGSDSYPGASIMWSGKKLDFTPHANTPLLVIVSQYSRISEELLRLKPVVRLSLDHESNPRATNGRLKFHSSLHEFVGFPLNVRHTVYPGPHLGTHVGKRTEQQDVISHVIGSSLHEKDRDDISLNFVEIQFSNGPSHAEILTYLGAPEMRPFRDSQITILAGEIFGRAPEINPQESPSTETTKAPEIDYLQRANSELVYGRFYVRDQPRKSVTVFFGSIPKQPKRSNWFRRFLGGP